MGTRGRPRHNVSKAESRLPNSPRRAPTPGLRTRSRDLTEGKQDAVAGPSRKHLTFVSPSVFTLLRDGDRHACLPGRQRRPCVWSSTRLRCCPSRVVLSLPG